MGKVNNVLKRYFRDKKRFADLFNGVFFEGRRVILEENLTDATETYVEPDEKSIDAGKYVERIRDIKMKLDTGEVLTLLALENQDVVDYAMPFRCMQYDTMEYAMQLDELRKKNEAANDYQTWAERACKVKKTDRIAPVYTLCMYHGEEEWDGPRSLKDMMDWGDDSEGMSRLFTDNRIEDAKLAASDETARNKFFEEYGIQKTLSF